MKTMMRRTALLLAVAYSGATAQNPPVQQATGTIAGTIVDRDTGTPIEGVSVFVKGGAFGTITKANGTYTILGVPAGVYTIVARKVGYLQLESENVVVRDDARRILDVELQSSERSTTTEPVRARAPMTVVTASSAVEACSGAPGSRFGIVSLQSASMTIENDGGRTVFSFQAEPVVINVTSWSGLRSGDVIQSVNGEPITTRAGAELFANPPPIATVWIRRNGEAVRVGTTTCTNTGVAYSGTAGPQGAGRGRGGRGGGVAGGAQARGDGTDTVRVGSVAAAGVRAQGSDTVRAGGVAAGSISAGRGGRAGGGVAAARTVITNETIRAAAGLDTAATSSTGIPLTAGDITRDTTTHTVYIASQRVVLRCMTPCVRTIAEDGNPYWKFMSNPVVTFRSAADRDFAQSQSGIRTADIVTSVNGESPLEERGAVALTHAALLLPLTLEVRRNGERAKVTLRR